MALTLQDVKDRLNITGGTNDAELINLLDAAKAEYRAEIGPLDVTSFTETHTGRTLILRRIPVVALTSVTDAFGDAVTGVTVDMETGIASAPYHGTYTVTYTAGYVTLPANVRELVLADVAGYYTTTQRGGGALRPNFPGEGFTEGNFRNEPVSMWPRIRAAARRSKGGFA